MSPQNSTPDAPDPRPALTLDDPRVLQILSTEHWSLLSARSLAYNEAFTRGGMFLTFLSMSFVALALAAQAMSFDRQFLIIAAIVLAFDVIIGLTTYGRIMGANSDDMRAVHGMSRIRHGYTQIAPIVEPYFTTGVHDDLPGVMITYGSPPSTWAGGVLYGLTTSAGMIGLIVSLVSGVLAGVLALLFGASGGLALGIGVVGAVAVFAVIIGTTSGYITRVQASVPVLFPTPGEGEGE
ncbi:MAG: hypothetical protein ACRDGD_05765, partial [Candidatus Limnocylindria bacterium]